MLQSQSKAVQLDRVREMANYCGRTIFVLDITEESHPLYTLIPYIQGIAGSGTWGCLKGAFRMSHSLLNWVGKLIDKIAIAQYSGLSRCHLAENISTSIISGFHFFILTDAKLCTEDIPVSLRQRFRNLTIQPPVAQYDLQVSLLLNGFYYSQILAKRVMSLLDNFAILTQSHDGQIRSIINSVGLLA
ncbi:MAG: hypothetical protein EZS28_001440 [Streblomastix strix]|uniref:Dynein heavy chain hydrolytic ATP-binding dynein motor region domain-containing protein n=1 Tax=Streblomastix strix TaxID=222440 RepID=A0A5J4X8E3_9EUKA|nr:MAG: hypothetical protein EZS28_001440 [Streblomastix strix]